MLLAACNKNSVDFSYSPETPRAGEAVTFTNLSTSGKEWAWTFGDGTSSTLNNPTKTFRRAGTYTVTLKVDNKSGSVKARTIVVTDTLPTFSVTTDTTADGAIGIYREVTLRALVYNPYNQAVTYHWEPAAGIDYELLSADMQSETMRILFRQPTEAAEITLRVTMDGKERTARQTLRVADIAAPALVMLTDEGIVRQRIFGARYADPAPSTVTDDAAVFATRQDSVTTYNGTTFRRADITSLLGHTVDGFIIVSRKVYARSAEGLWVMNLSGSHPQQITNEPVTAVHGDILTQRLYWSTDEGVLVLPLVQTDNNRYTDMPEPINHTAGVQKMFIDQTMR